MGLADLISEMQVLSLDKKNSEIDLDEKVSFPEGFAPVTNDSFAKFVRVGGYLNVPTRNCLEVSGVSSDPNHAMVVHKIFEEIKRSSFSSRMNFLYGVRWNLDDFLKVTNLPKLFLSSKISINRTHYRANSLKTRLEGCIEESKLDLKTNDWATNISGAGDYRNHLYSLASKSFGKNSIASINLCPKDAELLARRVEQLPYFLRKVILSAINVSDPKPIGGLFIERAPESTEGTQIIKLRTVHLPLIEEIIKKPIGIGSNDSTVTFDNAYLPFFNKQLTHLHQILMDSNNIEFGVRSDCPTITRQEARTHIEHELEIFRNGFYSYENHKTNSRPEWGEELRRFALSLGGAKLVALLDDFSDGEFSGIISLNGSEKQEVFAKKLRDFGYNVEGIMRVSSMYSKLFYIGGMRGVKSISKQVAREAHLLNLLCQRFSASPDQVVTDYMQSYVNPLPNTSISLSIQKRISNPKKLILPERAILTRLEVEDNSCHEYLLVGKRRYSTEEEVIFSSRTDVDKRRLINLQEMAAKVVGITIN